MSQSGSARTDIGSRAVVESDLFDQLVPPLPGLWQRLGLGLGSIMLAAVVSLGITTQGLFVPDPLPSNFEVDEVIVSPFGNGTDVYVQFLLPNVGVRDIEMQRVFQDNGKFPRVGALAAEPDEPIFGGGDGDPSIHYYLWSRQGRMDPVDGRLVVNALHDFESLPVVVESGRSSLITLIVPAQSCEQPSFGIGTLAAEVRFATAQRSSISHTERFEISDEVNVIGITEAGEVLSPDGIADAICGVVN